MSFVLVKIVEGVAYLWGESFALIASDNKYDDGWYFGKLSKNSFVDKKGVTRSYVKNLKFTDNEMDVFKILSIYYGTPDGLKCIIDEYKLLVPTRIRGDSRFNSLESLIKLGMEYSQAVAKEYEMTNFISKICYIVASRLVGNIYNMNEKETEVIEVQK